MLHATMLVEDCTIVATYRNDPPTHGEDVNANGSWHVICQDNLTGENRETKMNHEQFSAMSYLALSGDDDSDIAKIMYGRCEQLFKDWPNNVRPIP